MSLKDEIQSLHGNRRKFFLMRLADMDTTLARTLTGVTKGTYNTWLQNPAFVEIYRRRDELSHLYKQEAVQMLRRDNQLEAVLLESKILAKLKEELESGEYNLIRSQIAREVYSKLMTELDVVPTTQILSWEQRIGRVINNNTPEQIEGEVIDGESKEIPEPESQSPTCQLQANTEQGNQKESQEV